MLLRSCAGMQSTVALQNIMGMRSRRLDRTIVFRQAAHLHSWGSKPIRTRVCVCRAAALCVVAFLGPSFIWRACTVRTVVLRHFYATVVRFPLRCAVQLIVLSPRAAHKIRVYGGIKSECRQTPALGMVCAYKRGRCRSAVWCVPFDLDLGRIRTPPAIVLLFACTRLLSTLNSETGRLCVPIWFVLFAQQHSDICESLWFVQQSAAIN